MPRKKKEAPVLELVKKPRAKRPQPSPADQAIKMTDLEALRLGKLDAEVERIRSSIVAVDQALTISEFQIREQIKALEATLTTYKERKAGEKLGLIASFNAKLSDYKAEVALIVEKYDLDADHFAYDPDTGVIRDLRQAPAAGESPPKA